MYQSKFGSMVFSAIENILFTRGKKNFQLSRVPMIHIEFICDITLYSFCVSSM